MIKLTTRHRDALRSIDEEGATSDAPRFWMELVNMADEGIYLTSFRALNGQIAFRLTDAGKKEIK